MRFVACLLLAVGLAPFAWADAQKPNFDDDIKPILTQHCQGCHNNDKQRGGLNLASFAALQAGGSSGAVVTAGDADKSRLYTMTAHKEEPVMPPSKSKIPDAQIELLKKWVELGLAENKGSKVNVPGKPKTAVALKTVTRGKPTGPPPMPKSLSLTPIAKVRRPGAILALAASPWAPVVAIGGPKQIVLAHTETHDTIGILPYEHGQINSLKFSRNGQYLLAAGGRGGLNGKAVLYSVETGAKITEVGSAETDAILTADLSPDQSLIAVGTTSRLVRIYQVSDGALVQTIKKHTDWVTAVEFSPDGVLLATGDRAGGIFAWEAATAREFHTLRGHTAAITDLSWRIDSNLLASASLDATTRLWEMENGRETKRWNSHVGGAESVRFLADGRLVTTGRDKLTKLWDGEGKELRAFPATPDIGLRVVATHDNAKVITGDWSGHVQLWSSADAKPISTLSPNPGSPAEQLQQAEGELKTLEAAEQTARTAFTKLEADVKAKSDAHQAAQANLAKLTATLLDAQKQIPTLTATKARLDAEIAKSMSESTTRTATFGALTNKLAAKSALVGSLTTAVKELQAAQAKTPHNGELAGEVKFVQTLLQTQTSERDTLTQAHATTQKAIEQASAQLATQQKSLAATVTSLASQQKFVSELPAQVKSMTESLPGLKAQLETVQKAFAPAKTTVDAATLAVQTLKAKVERLRVASTKK